MALFFLLVSAGTISAASVAPTLVAKFVKESSGRLDERLLGEDDRRTCEGYLSRAQGVEKQSLVILMAQYRRVMEKNPAAELRLFAPFVLGQNRFQAWEMADAKAAQTALASWEKEAQSAKEEKREAVAKPTGPFEPFPSIQEWDVSVTNLPVVFELARMYMALGKQPEALRIANQVGAKFEGIQRVRAAECSGDAMYEASNFAKSVEFYEYALGGFRTLVTADGSLIDPEYKADRDRIEKSLVKGVVDKNRLPHEP
jgi:hypothetical protein